MPHSFQIAEKYLISLGLLCSHLVHLMLVTYFQNENNFGSEIYRDYIFTITAMYYGIGGLAIFAYPMIVRMLGLKKTLLTALSLDVVGLILLWISTSIGGSLPLIFICTVLLGLPLLIGATTIVSYFSIEFPKKLGVSLMVLFAFGETGVIFSSLLFDTFSGIRFKEGFFLLLAVLFLSVIYFIYRRFIEPPYPKHMEHLRKGSLIWKELHYRLAFFVIAAIGYGVVESIFSLWGELYLVQFMTESVATYTITIFWVSMLIGQILLLLPLYYLPMRQILPLLIIALVLTLIFIQRQTGLTGLIAGFAIAGFTCAAILPIIIASMEKELISASFLTHTKNYLPYIEIGAAVLLGSYYMGIGAVDLYVIHLHDTKQVRFENFFHWAIILTALMGLITMFLNWSSVSADQEQ